MPRPQRGELLGEFVLFSVGVGGVTVVRGVSEDTLGGVRGGALVSILGITGLGCATLSIGVA